MGITGACDASDLLTRHASGAKVYRSRGTARRLSVLLRRRLAAKSVGGVPSQNLYPRDHPEPKFLDQSNHPLAAAAEEPFLTTGAKSLFPLG